MIVLTALHHGDCLEVMAGMEPESVDAIVTDPPYGLGFMGKAWDVDFTPGDSAMRRRSEMDAVNAGQSRQGGRQRAGSDYQRRQARDARSYQAWCESWAAEALRVAKPGAYLLAFGGTRTYHRLACAIEDAGWEIRDCLVWAYAQGFPKSLNLPGGLGTALKPAWEPIVMARKPLRGTVAANVAAFGTGALNIDASRIGFAGVADEAEAKGKNQHTRYANPGSNRDSYSGNMPPRGDYAAPGRWPANVILTDPIFDGDTPGVVGGGQTGVSSGTKSGSWRTGGQYEGGYSGASLEELGSPVGYGDSGTYSRFFLIPKAARSDREPVLGGLAKQEAGGHLGQRSGKRMGSTAAEGANVRGLPHRANVHPTVKPTELMRHLVRLVTPPGGTVLDPFLGSGTTALACEMEGFGCIGIEKEAEYVAIAEARLNGTQRGLGLVG